MADPHPRHQQVAALLDVHLEGWPDNLLTAAHRMWDDYAGRAGRLTREPRTYAASLAYILARAAHLGETQRDIARRFSTSAGAISRAFPEMLRTLEILHREHAAVQAAATVARRIGEQGGALSGPDLSIPGVAAARLRELPTTADTWMLTIRRSLHWVMEPEPFRPLIVLLMVGSGSRVGDAHAIEAADDSGPAILQLVLDHMVACRYRPESIECDTAAFAFRALDALEGIGVPLAIGHAPELDDAYASLEAFSDREPTTPPDTALRKGVSPRVVALFHEAAARLARVEPWRLLPEPAVLSIQLDRGGYRTAAAVVIGRLGLDRGFLVFESAEDYVDFERITGTPVAEMSGPAVRLLSMGFDSATELAPERRREAMRHGWEVVAPDRYPVMRDIDYDRVERPATDDAYTVLTACAHAIAAVCEEFPSGPPGGQLELRVPIPHDAPAIIRLPHPDL